MKDKGTYYLANVKQRSSDWHFMRKGRITGSSISKTVGNAPYCLYTEEEVGEFMTGKKKEIFTPEAVKRMDKGTRYEDYVRKYLEQKYSLNFVEEGFCIWKENPIYGCSNDGAEVNDNDLFLEIKCPAKMYRPISEYMKNPDREKDSISHIYKSHIDQITMNGVVTNRKYAIFCVYAHEEKKIFVQKIKIDYDYWNDFLYPKSLKFYNEYMKPLL